MEQEKQNQLDLPGDKKKSDIEKKKSTVDLWKSHPKISPKFEVVLSKKIVSPVNRGSCDYYSLKLSSLCQRDVIIHLKVADDLTHAVRLSQSRISFTPETYHTPQIVGVQLIHSCKSSFQINHSVHSVDTNYNGIYVDSIVINSFRNDANNLWISGGNTRGIGYSQSSRFSLLPLTNDSSISCWDAFACGEDFTIASSSQSKLCISWGSNASGQLGSGDFISNHKPFTLNRQDLYLIGETPEIQSISCGASHVAIVTMSGRLFTWGDGKYGQCGNLNLDPSSRPHHVEFKSSKDLLFTQVACGSYHTLVLSQCKNIYAMGRNQAGQLGLGYQKDSVTQPSLVTTLKTISIIQISAGMHHSACVDADGYLYLWGSGSEGRLGNNSEDSLSTPLRNQWLTDHEIRTCYVSCGGRHTGIISHRKNIYLWGANEQGQLGLGDVKNRYLPTPLIFAPFAKGVRDLRLGQFHSACISYNGDVYSWGFNVDGGLGHTGKNPLVRKPKRINDLVGLSAVQIACGWSHTVVLTKEKIPFGGDSKQLKLHEQQLAKDRLYHQKRKNKHQAYWNKIRDAMKEKNTIKSIQLDLRNQILHKEAICTKDKKKIIIKKEKKRNRPLSSCIPHKNQAKPSSPKSQTLERCGTFITQLDIPSNNQTPEKAKRLPNSSIESCSSFDPLIQHRVYLTQNTRQSISPRVKKQLKIKNVRPKTSMTKAPSQNKNYIPQRPPSASTFFTRLKPSPRVFSSCLKSCTPASKLYL